MNRICIITNIGTHYRYPIFNEIRKSFNADFFLGDKLQFPIKTFNYKDLEGYKGTVHNRFFGKFYWQDGTVRLVNKPYDYYILDGEPYCLSSWAILIYAKLKGKKTISWSHGWYGREGFIKRLIKKAFYSLFSYLMIYSEYAINLMEKEGFKRKRMFCIANSLDSDHEKAIRKELKPSNIYSNHFKNNNPTIIYCGRIQKVKKLPLIIDSIKILKDQGIKVNAVFIGKDIDDVNLPALAKRQGITDQIWMYGPCYEDKKLAELFYNAAVCVSPGNIGLTAIHTLSFGCPAITHDDFANQMPEFEAIKQGLTGGFFHEGDSNDLANKIKPWLFLTPEQREDTRKAAYAEIDRKWNIHYQIDVIKQVLNAN
jgi:glycosyltransferase involved in cell wall biosynthesis